jgi:hypothetical protein
MAKAARGLEGNDGMASLHPTHNTRPRTRAAALAQFFRERPGRWIDGRELAAIAGAYAWRTRISDLRRPPFSMHIVNRQRGVAGAAACVSEYRFIDAAAAELPFDR